MQILEENLKYDNSYADLDSFLKKIKEMPNKPNPNIKYSYKAEKSYSLDYFLTHKRDSARIKKDSFAHLLLQKYNINYIETIDERLGGYYFDNGKLHIAVETPKLTHELAHILFCENERLLLPDFGYKLCRDYLNISDKFFLKIVSVEARVRGIQSIIEGKSKISSKLILEPWLWVINYKKYQKHNRYPCFKFNNDKEMCTYLCKLFDNERKRWSINMIENQLTAKFDYIFDYLNNNKTYTKTYCDLHKIDTKTFW